MSALTQRPIRMVVGSQRSRTVTVTAPEVFQATHAEPRNRVIEFFNTVSGWLRQRVRVRVDFAKTQRMHPCATLILLAKLDIWCFMYPGLLSGTYPEDEVVEQLFQHFGVLPMLGLTPRQQVTHDRVKYWFYFSGTKVEPGGYRDLTTAVRSSIEHPEPLLFGDCLNEAVTNAVNHAYKFDSADVPPHEMRKWWMLSQFKDGALFVAIYDHGVSIPRSLRRKPEFTDFATLRYYKGARLIKEATKSLRTTTRLKHRGKGLPEMLEFSSSLSQGGLSILSNDGAWVYVADGGRETTATFDKPLPGTLVLWELALRPEPRNERDDDIHS